MGYISYICTKEGESLGYWFQMKKINYNKMSMSPCKQTDIFWTANICHVSVFLPTYCILLFIYSSTHPSIIPSINHETDGLSGVCVRTDGFPLPQPCHYAPPPTPPEPHITHTHTYTFTHTDTPPAPYTSTTWTSLTICYPLPWTTSYAPGKGSSAYQLLIHTLKKTW